MIVPENMPNGVSEFVRLSFGRAGGVLISKARLCLGNVAERGVDLHVIHEQGHVISGGDVVDAETPIS